MPNNSQEKSLERLLDELCAQATTADQAALVLDRILRDIIRPHHSAMFWGDRMLALDRSVEFRDDPAFQAARAHADSSTGQNQYESPDGISWRYNTLIWAARTCLGLPGDYVECGVYRGDMTWMITETVNLPRAGKTFYIYDTFSGFDPKYSSPADFPDAPQFFEIVDKDYKSPNIETQVRERFSRKPYVVVTKGSVPDILRVVAPSRIALLHLDMNSPAAELGALEVLFDRISPGGILIFDDYGWTLFRKQKQAADAFMAVRGNLIMELPTGQGLMVKR